MGGKRMSKEEKAAVILGIYHQSKSVYTEKEILALAAKAGVNASSAAEVHNSMVDDGKVDKSKIGGSNFFWSFPGKEDRLKQLQHQATLKEIEQKKAEMEAGEAELASAKRGREDSGEEDGAPTRAQKMARLDELTKQTSAMTTELASLKENDPQAMADLQKELMFVMQGANRWTDNIFNCSTYMTKKRGMLKKEVNRMLGINDSFDYPEDKIPK